MIPQIFLVNVWFTFIFRLIFTSINPWSLSYYSLISRFLYMRIHVCYHKYVPICLHTRIFYDHIKVFGWHALFLYLYFSGYTRNLWCYRFYIYFFVYNHSLFITLLVFITVFVLIPILTFVSICTGTFNFSLILSSISISLPFLFFSSFVAS